MIKFNSDTEIKRLDHRLIYYCLLAIFFFLPLATSPAVIASSLAIGIWLISGSFIRDRHKWIRQNWTIPVTAFMILTIIGLLWTNNMTYGLEIVSKSRYWLLAFIVASLPTNEKIFRQYITAFVAGLLVLSAFSILTYSGFVSTATKLPTIFSGKSITASLFLVLGILFLSFEYKLHNQLKHRLIIISLIFILFFALSICGGRIGHVAFILLSPWVIFNMLKDKGILKISLLYIISVALLMASPTVQERACLAVKNIEDNEINSSIGIRLHQWESGIKIFTKNILLGVGSGSYSTAMTDYKKPGMDPININPPHPHNSYIYIGASYGITGLMIFLWLVYTIIKNGWNKRISILGQSIIGYSLIFCIGSLTDTLILSVSHAPLLALLTGIGTKENE
ncbi:MAG: O-antigen ligase family protein [Dissulfurispiraceae bacterium]|jgi:O-antigen ligase|nr:O-antigen ligase family protein [Dissulfurispiraceae bacterium]